MPKMRPKYSTVVNISTATYNRIIGMVESFEMDQKPNICGCVVLVVIAAVAVVLNGVAFFLLF